MAALMALGAVPDDSGLPVLTAAQACPVSCGTCPSCDDGKQNGDETGTDCGGSICSACSSADDCGDIAFTGLVAQNLEAVCTGSAVGDTCFTRVSAVPPLFVVAAAIKQKIEVGRGAWSQSFAAPLSRRRG